jgi:hypothetical protein
MPSRSSARTLAVAVALIVAVLPPTFGVGASKKDEADLTYDHRLGTWTVTPRDDFEMAAGYPGAPTVFVPKGQKVKVRIVNTNPLLFAITSVSVKEEDTQLLKSLQDLASLLGKVVGAALQVKAPLAAGAGKACDTTVVGAAIKILKASLDGVSKQLAALAAAKAMAMDLLQRGEFIDLPANAYNRSIWNLPNVPANVNQPPPPLTTKINEVALAFSELRTAKEDLESLPCDLSQVAGVEQILKAADDLLAKSDDARKAAANLEAFDQRRYAAAAHEWQIDVPAPATGVRWDKSQEYTVELKADSPYVGDIARNPQLKDVTLTYTVRWRGESVLGVSVGVTYTPLEDHTWAALPLPSDPTKLSPQVKTTETRAGQLALFLNWRAVQTFWPETRKWKAKPGIEVGATLNTDKLGAYVGASLEVLKVLRIAYGRTWQRVTVLDGQVAGVTVVQSEADVRTRQTFTPSWYASFSFALDSLTLFKKE